MGYGKVPFDPTQAEVDEWWYKPTYRVFGTKPSKLWY
jgi:hypothetical protein